ncbi:MAG: hypothetical protein Q8K63_14995 [Acidimicrobiales bacterium]|nr:hypothetical protein [Acidimicrobiales bacterium]
MDTRTFDLFELLDWFEDVLDDRANYAGEWLTIFATEQRFIEMHITASDIWFGAVTNYNLTVDERIATADELLLGALGWELEGLGGPAPKWMRSFAPDARTGDIVATVMRAFTTIYLPDAVMEIAVGRGMFVDYQR